MGISQWEGALMFVYEKKLQYPVKIRNTNPALAKFIISQYGGPDGELGASLRYLSQRYSMPYPELKGLLTDIGTEAPKCAACKRRTGLPADGAVSACGNRCGKASRVRGRGCCLIDFK